MEKRRSHETDLPADRVVEWGESTRVRYSPKSICWANQMAPSEVDLVTRDESILLAYLSLKLEEKRLKKLLQTRKEPFNHACLRYARDSQQFKFKGALFVRTETPGVYSWSPEIRALEERLSREKVKFKWANEPIGGHEAYWRVEL